MFFTALMSEQLTDVDKVLLHLEPKEFTVEPSTLQALQQLIQWVADLALSLLARLPEHHKLPGVRVASWSVAFESNFTLWFCFRANYGLHWAWDKHFKIYYIIFIAYFLFKRKKIGRLWSTKVWYAKLDFIFVPMLIYLIKCILYYILSIWWSLLFSCFWPQLFFFQHDLLLSDLKALNVLRELLAIIRIWGLLNQSCLPIFSKTAENLDVLVLIFKLLSRYVQCSEPDEQLLGKNIYIFLDIFS